MREAALFYDRVLAALGSDGVAVPNIAPTLDFGCSKARRNFPRCSSAFGLPNRLLECSVRGDKPDIGCSRREMDAYAYAHRELVVWGRPTPAVVAFCGEEVRLGICAQAGESVVELGPSNSDAVRQIAQPLQMLEVSVST
jgi:hypothetical protein